MSTPDLAARRINRPLVYATRVASRDAAMLLRGRAIENVVGAAIAAGRIKRRTGARHYATVRLDDDELIAIVRRAVSPLSGRGAWIVLAVREYEREAA